MKVTLTSMTLKLCQINPNSCEKQYTKLNAPDLIRWLSRPPIVRSTVFPKLQPSVNLDTKILLCDLTSNKLICTISIASKLENFLKFDT